MKEYRDIKLYTKESGLLYVLYGEKEIEVHVKKCFPWSNPGEWLSLRDTDDNEICLIENLKSLDSVTANVLKEHLNLIDFVLEIKKIVNVFEDVELRRFEVETLQGVRKFQTKLEEWPEILDDGSIIIRDLSGDLFRVHSFEDLDLESKKLLGTYVA